MRWIFGSVILAMFFLPALVAGLPDAKRITFIGCHDGDTCTFIYLGGVTRVRLAGIDAPEIGKRARCTKERTLAEAAKKFLEWHLKRAKRIDLVDVVLGLRRLRARVLVDGKDLSILALAKGRARIYNGGKRKGWC